MRGAADLRPAPIGGIAPNIIGRKKFSVGDSRQGRIVSYGVVRSSKLSVPVRAATLAGYRAALFGGQSRGPPNPKRERATALHEVDR